MNGVIGLFYLPIFIFIKKTNNEKIFPSYNADDFISLGLFS